MMKFRLVDLDKAPRVYPVVIGDIICQLLATVGATETEACDNLNLCYILESVIEGYIHTNLDEYINSLCPSAEYQALLYGGSFREKGLRGAGQR